MFIQRLKPHAADPKHIEIEKRKYIIKHILCLKVSRKTVSCMLISAFIYMGSHGTKIVFEMFGIITFVSGLSVL